MRSVFPRTGLLCERSPGKWTTIKVLANCAAADRLNAVPKLPKHSLRNTSPRIIWGPVLQHPLLNERQFGHRQQTLGQDGLHQFPLSQTLALRCGLKILVRHMHIAVP